MSAPVVASMPVAASELVADVNESDSESGTNDDTPMNTAEDLQKGMIRTGKNKTGAAYTILLVGETGVGKSSFLELIANVMAGNSVFEYDFSILDSENEAGGSEAYSQTNAALLYELESKNGQKVRILDTPGLADTRGLQQDELHRKSIATQINNHIEFVDAVIILANGTVPRITVGTDYALNTLSAMFPKSLADNIAFVFTNVSSPLSWNLSQDSVPSVLKGAHQFLLDNPIALRKKYDNLKLRKDPKGRMKQAVKDGEQVTLDTLAEVFDWLDGLTPQPTKEIVALYVQSQHIEQEISNSLARMEQASAKKKEISRLMEGIGAGKATMDIYSKYQQTVLSKPWKQVESTTHNTLCSETGCYSNCHQDCSLECTLDPDPLEGCRVLKQGTCSECKHPSQKHCYGRVLWEQVPETQITIDAAMKQKWESARAKKKRDEGMLEQMRQALDDLTTSIEDSTGTLYRLASKYANLALSGSFSAQIEKAVSLLAQKLQSMQERGDDQESLQRVEESLEMMKKKLEIMKKAEDLRRNKSFFNRLRTMLEKLDMGPEARRERERARSRRGSTGSASVDRIPTPGSLGIC